MSILEIQNLSKKYAGNTSFAVDSVSLKIEQGEIIALLGESGSGKTTLLRLLAGFEQAHTGKLYVNGLAILDLPPEKRNIGMVFQDYALFPHMTVSKNVAYGISTAKTKYKTVKEVLELVGLEDFGSRFPHQLSGGQQQRVALARALATKPDVLLLDEPFSNLDEALKEQVRSDLKTILNKSGITAIFVTHDTRDALAVADRIAILKEGKLQQFSTPQELYEKPVNQYIAQYFGKINWLDASIQEGRIQTALGTFPIEEQLVQLKENYQLGIRPEYISLSDGGAHDLTAIVTYSKYFGHYQETGLKVGQTELHAHLDFNTPLSIGEAVNIQADSSKFILLPKGNS